MSTVNINVFFRFYLWVKNKSVLFKVLSFFALLYFLLLLTIVNQFISDSTLNWGFCFTNSCLEVVSDNFKYKLILLKEITILCALCLTGLSVVTGLQTYKLSLENSIKNNENSNKINENANLTYRLSLENSILNNHNSNLKCFIDFCHVEVLKYDLLDASKIDFYKLYNNFFPQSREGEFNKYSNVNNVLVKLKENINLSNVEYKERKDNKAFKYRNHQKRTIEAVLILGFNIDFRGRVDFYRIESQIYKFTDSLILNFTVDVDVISSHERKYNIANYYE